MKNLSKLGTVLTKAEQKTIIGGKAKCELACLWILDPIKCECIGRDLS